MNNNYTTTSTFGPIGVTSASISASSLWSPFTGRDRISFKGEEYDIQEVQICSDGTIEIRAILAHPSNDYYIGNKKVKTPKFRCTNKYGIKKIQINPKKDATTVIFKDGSVEVVKKSPDDNEADIYSVVAYAIAKHIYGSNSAFQKEVAKNIQFTKDKELNKLISKTSIGELNSALRNILNALKREVK